MSVNGVLDYYSNEQIISVLATAFCPTIGWGIGVEEAMSVPDWLKTNAYRVLRIPAGASLTDVHKAATSMRRSVRLGAASATEADIPVLGEIPRTEADIRVATGRLENPTQRIFDRLFWLHSIDSAVSVRPGGLDTALWNHDQALRAIFAAFEKGFDEAGIWAWARALRAWHQVVSDEGYWTRSFEFENDGGFEPAAFPSEIDELRSKAVKLAAEPLVMAGRDALYRGELASVRRIMASLDELVDTGTWAAVAQQNLVSPMEESIRESCRVLDKKFSSAIIRSNDAGDQNKHACTASLKYFRDAIEPPLNKILSILQSDSEEATIMRGEVADSLYRLSNDFTWADDYIVAEQLRKEAIKMADGTIVAIRIADGLELIQIRAEEQRKRESISPDLRIALDRFDKAILSVSVFRSRIVREQANIEQNGQVCDEAIREYRSVVEPALNSVLSLTLSTHEVSMDTREGAALCLSGIATDYTWADEFIVSSKLREEALKLAQDTPAASRIQDGLDQIRKSANKQKLLEELKPISSAPSLRTVNTVGFKLYGRSDYDEDSNSYATTHYFVAFFLPIFPVGRYRVRYNSGGHVSTWGYQFLGKLPFRKADRWHLGIVLSGIAAMILYGMVSSNQSQSYTPSATTSSSYASPSGQNADSSASDTNSGNAPSSSQSTSDTPTTFKIPVRNSSSGEGGSEVSSNDAQLSALRSRIEAGRTRITALETQLQPAIDELTRLDGRMKPLAAEIKSLDEQHSEGVEIDIDDRNTKVDEYNRLLARRRALISANKSDMQTHEDLKNQDATLLEQYKSLGGRVR